MQGPITRGVADAALFMDVSSGTDTRARLESGVEGLRMLWSGEPVTRSGGDFELTEHTIGPLPWNPAGPPVLITAANRGEMLPAQFERFARLPYPTVAAITTMPRAIGAPAR